MDIVELIDRAGVVVAIAATLAFFLLLPLYVSQRRDLMRLRDWMEREPGHPGEDLVASDAILDRAEAELEALVSRPAEAGDTEVREGPAAISPAARVRGDRPALERVTMERAALDPHPRWHRFAQGATRTKALAAIGVVMLLVGAGGIFGAEQLLTDGKDGGGGGSFDPSSVEVAVLNGTGESGLAQKVGDDLQAFGFRVATVTNTEPGFEQTVVMFQPGQEKAARKVARKIGVAKTQPIDRARREAAGEADVVVIAGEDRALA